MMQHNSDPSEKASEAAQTRVKVDMLARAIASLEEQKQQRIRALEGTALVGDVVKDLQLDVSPEELLAEVQAQTKAAEAATYDWKPTTASQATQAIKRLDTIPRILLFAALIIVAAVLYNIWLVGSYHSSRLPYQNLNRQHIMVQQPNVTNRVGQMPAEGGLQFGQAVHPLSIIADGHSFGMTTFTLSSVLRHQPLDEIMLYDAERDMAYDPRKPHSDPHWNSYIGPFVIPAWTGIKYDGRVYLRGWVAASAKQHVVSDTPISLFNVQSPPANVGKMVPITLPLDVAIVESVFQEAFASPSFPDIPISSFASGMSRVNTQEMFVRSLPQDPHLWEPWEPSAKEQPSHE